ncbi:hypothetical protein CDAR_24281 [Caerostris darwini]|uniref:Uncharacterized protein n=1 Tax=Caerostris darwini TaxID=1538125 RepID=A0AAV4QK62_9ARAC|nr:hypothetical protein CDAR_24281 [Caerostris darwini]
MEGSRSGRIASHALNRLSESPVYCEWIVARTSGGPKSVLRGQDRRTASRIPLLLDCAQIQQFGGFDSALNSISWRSSWSIAENYYLTLFDQRLEKGSQQCILVLIWTEEGNLEEGGLKIIWIEEGG